MISNNFSNFRSQNRQSFGSNVFLTKDFVKTLGREFSGKVCETVVKPLKNSTAEHKQCLKNIHDDIVDLKYNNVNDTVILDASKRECYGNNAFNMTIIDHKTGELREFDMPLPEKPNGLVEYYKDLKKIDPRYSGKIVL